MVELEVSPPHITRRPFGPNPGTYSVPPQLKEPDWERAVPVVVFVQLPSPKEYSINPGVGMKHC